MKILDIALLAGIQASKEVLFQYKNGFETQKKTDNSFVTSADIMAHKIINQHLTPTEIPILSEEGNHFSYETRKSWKNFWCIDPIDGTLEFVNKTDEFAICIGLIENDKPKLGVLIAPAMNLLYYAEESIGSYKLQTSIDEVFALKSIQGKIDFIKENSIKLPLQHPENDKYIALSSKSFRNDLDEEYKQSLEKKHQNFQYKKIGSAIKLGIIAEGKANEFTRLRTVNFWDIAAGHAIAKFSGLQVNDYYTQQEISYKESSMKIRSYSMIWD